MQVLIIILTSILVKPTCERRFLKPKIEDPKSSYLSTHILTTFVCTWLQTDFDDVAKLDSLNVHKNWELFSLLNYFQLKRLCVAVNMY